MFLLNHDNNIQTRDHGVPLLWNSSCFSSDQTHVFSPGHGYRYYPCICAMAITEFMIGGYPRQFAWQFVAILKCSPRLRWAPTIS